MFEIIKSSRPGRLYTFLNPYSYLVARKNKDVFSGFAEIYFDGIALCLIARLFGVKKRRISFDMTSLAPVVLADASSLHQRVYLIGSEVGVAEVAAKKLSVLYPDLDFVGIRSGFFVDQLDRESAINEIVGLAPDLVISGMGTPYQEKFLVDLVLSGWNGVGYTCGGFIHQTAKSGVSYYPVFFDKFHLRWLYRIIDEPKLIKRYAIDYPKFLFYFGVDFLAYLKNKN